MSEIVSAYVSNNHVAVADLPTLIASVQATLGNLATGGKADVPEATVEKPTAVQIRKSITPDALISFIDGKPYKTLKRHLTKHGLTPQSYRTRFGLPTNYPLVAAAYSERRSDLARALGLGQVGDRVEQAPKAQKKGS